MKPTNLETMIADQQFKISKADENISDFFRDCDSCVDFESIEILCDGTFK